MVFFKNLLNSLLLNKSLEDELDSGNLVNRLRMGCFGESSELLAEGMLKYFNLKGNKFIGEQEGSKSKNRSSLRLKNI